MCSEKARFHRMRSCLQNNSSSALDEDGRRLKLTPMQIDLKRV